MPKHQASGGRASDLRQAHPKTSHVELQSTKKRLFQNLTQPKTGCSETSARNKIL